MTALTIGELRSREKSRHYAAAMRARWATTATPKASAADVAAEQAALDAVLGAGVLVFERGHRNQKLENHFYQACKRRDRPFVIVRTGATVDIEIDFVTTRRTITDWGVEEADRLIQAARRVSRRVRDWSTGREIITVSAVPFDLAANLLQELLALPTIQRVRP